jgi:integrase
VTFSQWGHTYFEKNLNPNSEMRSSSSDRERRSFVHLETFFGDLPLVELTKGRILEYRKKRAADGVEFTTINRELSFANVAADQDDPIIDRVPRFKLPGEGSRARTRTLDNDEYTALISQMRRRAQRYVIALYETSMRLEEPQALTWDRIDLKAGLIRFEASDVKEKYPRRTPISWEFRQALLEIKEEQKRIANLDGYIFTHKNGRPIKSIRTAFERASKQAKLSNVVPHDLRRTAITRWTEFGIPRDIVMAASGHKPQNVHDRYLNFSDKQLTDAFKLLMISPEERNLFTSRLHGKSVENASAASY